MHDDPLVPKSGTLDNPTDSTLTTLHRFGVALLVGACLAFAYLAINQISSKLPYDVDVLTSMDHAIPFVPEWVWIYTLNIPMPLTLIIVITQAERLLELIGGYVVIFSIAALTFLVLPVHSDVLRPDLTLEAPSLSLQMVSYYYALDKVGNCMPSLHVAYSVYAGWWGIRLMPARWGYPYALVGVLITLSTMFVKQHLIADVVSAIGIAGAVYLLQAHRGVSMRRFVPGPIKKLLVSFRKSPSS